MCSAAKRTMSSATPELCKNQAPAQLGRVRQLRHYRQQLFARQLGTPLKAINVTGATASLRVETRPNLNHLVCRKASPPYSALLAC